MPAPRLCPFSVPTHTSHPCLTHMPKCLHWQVLLYCCLGNTNMSKTPSKHFPSKYFLSRPHTTHPCHHPILISLLISHLVCRTPGSLHLTMFPDFHRSDPGPNCHHFSPRLWAAPSLVSPVQPLAPHSMDSTQLPQASSVLCSLGDVPSLLSCPLPSPYWFPEHTKCLSML